MKKRVLLLIFCFSLLCGFVYVSAGRVEWKKFYDTSGKSVRYPVLDFAEEKNEKSSFEYSDFNNLISPETAEIGDVFKGQEGYERVIAVSEDGAYVTEIINESSELHK